MKYLIVDMYISQDKYEELLNIVLNDEYDMCVFFSPDEWEYWFPHERIWSRLFEIIKQRGKIIDVITGAHKVLFGEPIDSTIRVHRWETRWITHIMGLEFPLENTYKYHYIYMNNKAHDWRCQLIDLVHKNNLSQYGAISWHNHPTNYDWKYFQPTELKLTDSFNKDALSVEKIRDLPVEYKQSFAQLVSENNTAAIFMTEKTVIPLMLGKPFLVSTAPGYHKFLQELGFELYTEIFDYSFDNETDQEQRFEMILDNFTKLCLTPLEELPILYKKIEAKIEHNKRQVILLSTRKPDILNDLPKEFWCTEEWRNNLYMSVNI